MKRVTASMLENWAKEPDCQVNLSLLVRRLIKASPVQIHKILFPSGSSVVLPGYDGTLETTGETVHVPAKKSIWEISARKDYKKKAEEDLKKGRLL